MQQSPASVSRTFHHPKQTLSPLNRNSPSPPDNRHSISLLYEFDYSSLPHISSCLFVSGFFLYKSLFLLTFATKLDHSPHPHYTVLSICLSSPLSILVSSSSWVPSTGLERGRSKINIFGGISFLKKCYFLKEARNIHLAFNTCCSFFQFQMSG